MSEKKGKGGIFAFFAKIGPKLFGLAGKMMKLLKLTKVALAAVTFAGYAAVFSWKFALLLMAALAFHESGHVWAMKKMGIKTKGFYFLPFIGGAAIAEEKYKTQGQHAFIAIMGPVWGGALAAVSLAIYYTTDSVFFAAAAGWMATLNLFNLLPINPLDGGQLVRCIAFSLHKVAGILVLLASLIGCIFLFHFLGIGLFVLLFIVGGLDLFWEWRKYKKARDYLKKHPRNYAELDITDVPDLTKGQMAVTILSYAGVAAILFGISFATRNIPGADIAHTFLQ